MVCQPCHTPEGGFKGSLCATGDRERSNVSVAPAEAGGIPRVRSRSDSGLAPDTLSEPSWRGARTGEGQPAPSTPRRETQTYRLSFPKHLCRLRCPVTGCLGGASSRINLQIHFARRHVQDTIMILEEGSHPYPRCPQCDMSVPQKTLNK